MVPALHKVPVLLLTCLLAGKRRYTEDTGPRRVQLLTRLLLLASRLTCGARGARWRPRHEQALKLSHKEQRCGHGTRAKACQVNVYNAVEGQFAQEVEADGRIARIARTSVRVSSMATTLVVSVTQWLECTMPGQLPLAAAEGRASTGRLIRRRGSGAGSRWRRVRCRLAAPAAHAAVEPARRTPTSLSYPFFANRYPVGESPRHPSRYHGHATRLAG